MKFLAIFKLLSPEHSAVGLGNRAVIIDFT